MYNLAQFWHVTLKTQQNSSVSFCFLWVTTQTVMQKNPMHLYGLQKVGVRVTTIKSTKQIQSQRRRNLNLVFNMSYILNTHKIGPYLISLFVICSHFINVILYKEHWLWMIYINLNWSQMLILLRWHWLHQDIYIKDDLHYQYI